MDRFVLIVGGISSEFEQVVRATLPLFQCNPVFAASVQEAKRMLLRHIPQLILCGVEIEGQMKAGISFSQQLQDHAQLGEIPVILFSSKISQELVREVALAGARGFLSLPTTKEVLRNRLGTFLVLQNEDFEVEDSFCLVDSHPPEHSSVEKRRSEGLVVGDRHILARTETEVHPTPVRAPLESKVESHSLHNRDAPLNKGAHRVKGEQEGVPVSSAPVDDMAQKLEMVNSLLMKVLHNLRTSHLLQVVEVEDVPKVVFEITRSVCGISTELPRNKADGVVEIDIDAAIKHK